MTPVKCERDSRNYQIFFSKLQTYYHLKLYFQNVDQLTGGKWLIHGTKRRKVNQLQSLELPCRMLHVMVENAVFTTFVRRPNCP